MTDSEHRCRSMEMDGARVIACGRTPTDGDIAAIREFQEFLRTLRRGATEEPRASSSDGPGR